MEKLLANQNTCITELETVMLQQCTEFISAAASFDAALQHTIDIVCTNIGFDVGHVYALDVFGQNQVISTPIWYIKNKEKHDEFRKATETLMHFKAGHGLPGEVLATKKPAWVENIQNDPDSPRRKLCNDMAVKGAFAFPVIENGKIISVLEFFSDQPLKTSERFENTMLNIGKYIASLLSKKYLEKFLNDQKFALDKSALVSQTDATGRIMYANDAFCDLFKYSQDDLIGKDHAILSSNLMSVSQVKDLWNTISNGEIWKGEFKNIASDGSIHWLSSTITPLLDEKGKPYQFLNISFDITDMKKNQEQVENLAYHDILTNLPNRLLFEKEVKAALHHAKRQQQSLSVIYFDVDHFKTVNETFGTDKGDHVLSDIAWRLNQFAQNLDTHMIDSFAFKNPVARIAGNQFAILMVEDEQLGDIHRFLSLLKATLETPFRIQDQEITLTYSFGVSRYPEDACNAEDLIKFADIAQQEAQEAGRDTIKFYQTKFMQKSSIPLKILSKMRNALANDEFVLIYQPKIDTVTQKIHSVEALIRWNHDGTTIEPTSFIPFAERTRLIVPIGDWVIQTACAECKRWHQQGFTDLTVAVNVSARQLTNEFPNKVKRMLDAIDFPATHLEIEFTERVLLDNDKQTLHTIEQLKAMGIRISIDDFGTGYSSLRYLSDYDVDYLKIDMTFIQDIPAKEQNNNITHAVISLAHHMGMKVIAEGVENQAQYEFLKEKGCDYLQGFLFSKPLPGNGLLYLLKEQERIDRASSEER